MLFSLIRWLVPTVPFLFSGLVLASDLAQNPQAINPGLNGQDRVLNFNVSTGGYPPYLIHNSDGTFDGIAYEVVTRIANRLGYEVSPHKIPRKRTDAMLMEGHIDATPRAREWTEEPQRFLFTDAIVPIREVFFSPAESGFRFEGMHKLRNVTLVTPLGYHYPNLAPLFADGRIDRYDVSGDRDVFTYLLHGRGLDAAVADLAVGRWIIRQQGWQGKFKYSREALNEYGYRLMLRPDWQPFAEAFNAELAQMKASGELEEILDQYR